MRDLLLSMATTDLFRARWTDRIHDEWIRNLTEKGYCEKKLNRTRALMNAAVPDCLVTGYEDIIDGINLPDLNDRHVIAAAIAGDADVIVTRNLKDFPSDILSKFSLEAQDPDYFVMYQFDLNPERYCESIKAMRNRLRKPPMTVNQFIESFAKLNMPKTIALLKSFDNKI
jgi:hypothetical protein